MTTKTPPTYGRNKPFRRPRTQRKVRVGVALIAILLALPMNIPSAEGAGIVECPRTGADINAKAPITGGIGESGAITVQERITPFGPIFRERPQLTVGATVGFDDTGCFNAAASGKAKTTDKDVDSDNPEDAYASETDYGEGQGDSNRDGMGDTWQRYWYNRIEALIKPGMDLDNDGLSNLNEFRWELIPACLPYNDVPLPNGVSVVLNCQDHEAGALNGTGGDQWLDGPEVWYWNNPSNDALLALDTAGAVGTEAASFYDPDRLQDTDADNITNVKDTDSDNDGLLDGVEFREYGIYPEFRDSDCSITASECTIPVEDNSPSHGVRVGEPGTGDGLNDSVEVAAWTELLGEGAWAFDLDFDGIHNLLDPDSDGDGLLDGHEDIVQGTRMDRFDTDRDALLDGGDVLVAADDPRLDLFLNAGIAHLETPRGTLFRGESGAGTEPTAWDTDGDGLPDGYEVHHGLDPRNAQDASMDTDQDGYNPDGAVPPAEAWTNIDEYRYGLPSDWTIAHDGVWWWGTDPTNDDTDGDGVLDGVEVHFGTDPTDGASQDPRGYGANRDPTYPVWQSDPTNEDLPEDEMDPTNLQYLRDGRADAAARANETVEVADELISAAIAGNVTGALNVIYNRTPVGPPLRNATETVALTQEALVSLVRCAPEEARPALETAASLPDRIGEGQRSLLGPDREGTLRDDLAPVRGVPTGGGAPVAYEAPALEDAPTDTVQGVEELAAASLANLPSILETASSATGFAAPTTEPTSQGLPDPEPLGTPEPHDILNPSEDPGGFAQNATNRTDAVAGCMMETLLPFLDALLNRTLQEVPVAQDLVATLREETIPGVVETADSVVPLDVQGTAQALLDRPVGTVMETTLDIEELATDPESLNDAVTQADAAVDAAVAQFIKPTTKHPQLLHDTLFNVGNGLEAHWPTVLEANEEVKDASDGGVDVIATVDAAALNLYTNRDGAENITAIPAGKRTCVSLDDSTATRDAGGCDLYATYSPTADAVGGEIPTAGRSLTPSLRIERAVPSATFDLEAVAYVQVPNEPYLMVLGYNATDGLPTAWEGTITEADVRETMDRSFAFTSAYEDTRAAMPLHLVAGAFRIDTGVEGKPAVPGNETVFHAASTEVPDHVRFGVQRAPTDPSGPEVDLLLDASGAADWRLLYRDDMDALQSRLAMDLMDLSAGTTRLQQDATEAGMAWSWSAAAVTDSVDIGYQERVDGDLTRAFQLNATDAPSTLDVESDRNGHHHAYTASTAPTGLDLLVGEGAASCQSLEGLADLHVLFDHEDGVCITGTLDGYTSLRADATSTQATANGARDMATGQNTFLVVRDGNTVHLETSESPASWSGDLAIVQNATQDLQWTATAATQELRFEARLDQGSRDQILAAHATDVPTQLDVQLDMLTGQGTLSASDAVGTADLTFSTTGSAPTTASSGDHLRLREVPVDSAGRELESSWHVEGARSLQARVLPGGAFEVTGDYDAPRPISVMYRDEERSVELTADSVTGSFQWLLEENGPLGTLSFTQDAATTGDVELAASMPGGLVHVDITDAPSVYAVTADLAAQAARFEGNGHATAVDAGYAPEGSHPTMPASSAFVVVQDDAAGTGRGFHLQASDVKVLAATQTRGTLNLDSDLATSAPLQIRFDAGGDAYLWSVSDAPATAEVSQGAGSLSWTASGVTDFSLQAALETGPRFLQASATQVPNTLEASWTGAYVDAFTAQVTHSAADLPAFSLQEYRGTSVAPGDEAAGTYLDLEDLPPQTTLRLAPADGIASATARTSSGQEAAVGRLDAAFGDRVQSLVRAQSTFDGDTVFLDDQGTRATAALLAEGLKELNVRLFLDASTEDYPIHAERATARDLYVEAQSARHGADARFIATDAAPSLEYRIRPGTDASDGFRVTSDASTAAGPLELRIVRENGRDLGFSTPTTTPASFEASWASGDVLHVSGSEAFNVTIQSAQDLGTAPWMTGKDFIAVEQATDTRFGARLTGVNLLELDSVGRTLVADGDLQQRPVVVDYADPLATFNLEASDIPRGLDLSWDPVDRRVSYTATDAVASLRFMTQGESESIPRLYASLAGLPAGTTTMAQDVSGRSFSLLAPAAVDRVQVSSDNGGNGPLQGLVEEGMFFTEGEGDLLRVNLAGVERMDVDLSSDAWLEREGTDSLARTLFRFQLPEQRLTAELDAVNAGVTRMDWPMVGAPLSLSASGMLGRGVDMAAVSDNDRVHVALEDAPESWSLDVAPTGALSYAASGPATSVESSALWQGAAFRLDAMDVPTGLTAEPAQGMRSGIVTATGGDVGRVALSLATTGTGAVPAPVAGGQDLLFVDATEAGGLLSLDMENLQSVSWSLPGSADEASGTPLSVDITRSTVSSRPALVQMVHPDHQTRARFSDGLPALLGVELVRGAANWNADLGVPGKSMALQHQDFNAGSFTLDTDAAPTTQSIHIDARAQQALTYTASTGSESLSVASNWGQGFVRATLDGVPSKFVVDANGLLPGQGLVSTQGTGSVGHASVLVVPDGGQTVNRVTSQGDHAAVELMAKAPYLSLSVEDLETFTWTLPDAGTERPLTAGLARSQSHDGESLIVLSGPREDVTAKITNSAPMASFQVDQSKRAGSTQPVRVQYTSTEGSTDSIAFTHVDAESGQMLSSELRDASGTSRIEASGAEPAYIDLDAANSQGGVFFETTDLGTALHLDAQDIPARLEAKLVRGDCGLTESDSLRVSTHGTGQAGATTALIGDGGRVPNGNGDFMSLSCDAGQAVAGAKVPFVDDASLLPGPCQGMQAKVPASRHATTRASVVDSRGIYDIGVQAQGGNGVLDIVLDCTSLHYQTRGVDSIAPELRLLEFGYSRELPGGAQAPDCIEMDDVCVNRILVDGRGLPSTATATFSGPGGKSGFQLQGAAGTSLDVHLVVEPKPESKTEDEALDMIVESTMPLGYLRFEKTDRTDSRTKGDAAPNMVLRIDDGSQDTVFIQAEKLTALTVELDTIDDFELDATYQGSSGRALEYYSTVKGETEKTQRAILSNMPSSLDLRIWVDDDCLGKSKPLALSATTTDSIAGLRYVKNEDEKECDPDSKAVGLLADLSSIPAGQLDVQSIYSGATGIIRAQSSGGPIGKVVLESTKGRADEFMRLSLKDVKLKVEWDLDGATRYPGVPMFAFLDTGGYWTDVNLKLKSRVGVNIVGVIRADDFLLRQDFDPSGAWTLLVNPALGAVDMMFKTAGSFCGAAAGIAWTGTHHGVTVPAAAWWCRF